MGYYFVDYEGISRKLDEGREFGRTTDSFGCQTKIISMVRTIRPMEVTETSKTSYFFDGCLETSRYNPEFCKGVGSDWTDIFNDHKEKDAICERLGLGGSIPCRQVMVEKLDFCDTKR